VNILAAIVLSGCVHFSDLVAALARYAPVQIQQVRLRSRALPPRARAEVDAALRFIAQARMAHRDPVAAARERMAEDCGIKGA